MAIRSALETAFRGRRGAAAMVFALLLPVLVGFIALSVDTSIIAAARSQLSTAADAAALAGAQQLANEYRVRGVTDMSSQITTANDSAIAFAAKNKVFNQPVSLVAGTIWTNSGDIQVGYLDPNNPHSSLVTTPALAPTFNSVQVTARRDTSRGGQIPTFFSSLMGFRGGSLNVPSTATVTNYTISGYKNVNGLNAKLLPIVLDVTTYNAMMAGVGTTTGAATDQYSYDPVNKTVSNGPDGVAESVLYPVASGNPGNWGTVKVGVSNNSTSVLAAQIQYGITPSQLATFPNGTIALDTTLTPPSITFGGNPGISAGIKSALDAIIGNPVAIPIYDQSGGNGNNAWYRVIAFASVRVMAVNFQGNPKYVVVQPALLTDPTAIKGSLQSSWTKGGLVVLRLSR
jgi:Flp pilus assembly protein TadG